MAATRRKTALSDEVATAVEDQEALPPDGEEVAPAATPSAGADAGRVGGMLDEIARIGADPGGGVSRLSFTEQERDAHTLVGGWLRDLGLQVTVDAVGNTVAERPGTRPGAPAIGVGSHLDSVPHGGRFDGIVGVVGAVELVRLLAQNDVTTRHPVRVVVFAGEEGARFGEPCIGSKVAVGALSEPDMVRLRDADGVTLAQSLREIGFDPQQVSSAQWQPSAWAAFLEMHIEQARVLETTESHVGLVDIVSGSTRFQLSFAGRADHSGGTPMSMRADAMAAAAEVVLAAERLANETQNRGARLTVGRLRVHPNSITTIPGRVELFVDVRDIDSDRQRFLASELIRRARSVAEPRGVRVEAAPLADTSPAVLPIWLRQLTVEICEQMGVRYRVMTSGAGHDAQVISRIAPAGMVFVPSKDGLSHVPEEWTSASDVARGVEVLYHSVLRLDDLLAALDGDGRNGA